MFNSIKSDKSTIEPVTLQIEKKKQNKQIIHLNAIEKIEEKNNVKQKIYVREKTKEKTIYKKEIPSHLYWIHKELIIFSMNVMRENECMNELLFFFLKKNIILERILFLEISKHF